MPPHKKTKAMNNEELIEWAKANLQEVQAMKDKTEKAKQIREYCKDTQRFEFIEYFLKDEE